MLNECLNNLPTTYRGHMTIPTVRIVPFNYETLLDLIYLNYRDIWVLHCFN